MVKKDLTFIHLGNDSFVDDLVNFEKLRMIAKEIRHICNMCSARYVSGVQFCQLELLVLDVQYSKMCYSLGFVYCLGIVQYFCTFDNSQSRGH